MPDCPNCGKYVRPDEPLCPHCLHSADFQALAKKEKERRAALLQNIESQQERALTEKARIREQAKSVPVVTLPYLPGYEVERAVGVISSEIVLGPGWSAAVSADWAGFLGTRSPEYEAKWREAKEAALMELRVNACAAGCNAVIGVDIELAMMEEVPVITATGTGVVVKKLGDVPAKRG